MAQRRIGVTLLRFQLRAGARVALRGLVPVAAGATAASVMYGSPMVVIDLAKGLLFSPDASIGVAVCAAGIGLAVASAAAARLTLGLAGWIRHLPASGVAHRRAATAGLAVVQLPVLTIVFLGGLAALSDQPSTTWPRLAALVPIAWSTSLAALTVEHRWTRGVAVAAAVAVWTGTWSGFLLGVVLAAVADLAAGAVVAGSRRRGRRRRIPGSGTTSEPGKPLLAAARLWLRLSLRALRWRVIASSVPGLFALVPVLLFLRNNQLTDLQRAIALRLAATLAVVLVMAATADGLVSRRPPWPWIRSLPWSASMRVSLDGALAVVVALPVLLVAVLLDAGTVWIVIGAVPLLGLRAAAAIRRAPGRVGGASGQPMLEGLLVAGLVALLPWMSLFFLAVTPLAVRQAAELERRREISRWHELHHLAAGDPLSWSET